MTRGNPLPVPHESTPLAAAPGYRALPSLPLVPQRLHGGIAILLIAIQPLLFFRKVLFWPTKSIPYDYLGWHFPLASFLARSARNGDFPWWNPLSYCGVPIHADLQAQLFYPITWIALLAGKLGESARSYYFYEWLNPVHMLLAGLFSFFLLRRLRCSPAVAFFGASVYQLGAFFASQAQHLGQICCAAWLPLAIWCVIELAARPSLRWTGLLALALALAVLSGFPEATFPVMSAVCLLGLFLVASRAAPPRSLLYIAAGIMLGLLICSIQLFPTLRLIGLSAASLRSSWYPDHPGFPWETLVSFLIPNYFHIFEGTTSAYTLPYSFTLLYSFCGHATICLLLAAPFMKRPRHFYVFLALALLSGLWMMGDKAYLTKMACLFLPASVRGALYCVDALMPFTLFVGVLAALTLSGVETRLPRKWASTAIWIVAVASSAELIWLSSDKPFNSFPVSYRRLNNERAFQGDQSVVTELTKLASVTYPPLRSDFANGENPLLRSASEVFNLPTANGDNPFMPLRYFRLRDIFAKSSLRERMRLLSSLDSPWIDALNVGAVIQSLYSPPLPEPKNPQHWETLTVPGLRVYRNRQPLPRFYLVNRITSVNGPDAAETALKDPAFAPALQAVVEGLDPQWHAADSLSGADVHVASYSNNTVDLVVQAPGPLYLVTSETWYPGWTATINGSKVKLYPTNLAFRGLPVPQGTSHLTMTYFPEHMGWWLFLTLASLATVLFLICKPVTE
jgi:Bacterial membrane protein YfhO